MNGGREGEGGDSKDYEQTVERALDMSGVIKRDLTERQRALVDAFVANGGNVAKAAHEAGYAAGNSGRASAYKAMKTPHVQQYLMQATADAFGIHAVRALGRVAELSSGAKSEYVQLEASKDLLDRAGFKPIDRSQVQIAGDIQVTIDLS